MVYLTVTSVSCDCDICQLYIKCYLCCMFQHIQVERTIGYSKPAVSAVVTSPPVDWKDTLQHSQTATMPIQTAPGVQILGSVDPLAAEILTVDAQRFVATLHRCFNGKRKELLHRRVTRQYEIDAGELPGMAARPKTFNGRSIGFGHSSAGAVVDFTVAL